MNPSNGPLPKPIAQRPRTGLDLLTLCALPAHSTASVPLPSSSYPSPSSLPSTSSFIQSFPPSPQTVLPPLSSLFLPCPPTVPNWPYPQHQGAFQPVFPSLHPCSSSSFPSSPFLFNPSSNSNPSFGANSLPSLSPSNSFPTLPPMTSASKATEQLPRPDDEEATTEDSASEENGPLSGPSAGSNPTNLEVKVPKKRGRRPKPPHEKRHPCELCQKEFKRMEHLRRHLLVHTGEKPFECPIPRCQRLFSRRDNLQQHYRTHSKEERDATSL